MDSGMGGGGIHFILGQQTSKHKSRPLTHVWGWVVKDAHTLIIKMVTPSLAT